MTPPPCDAPSSATPASRRERAGDSVSLDKRPGFWQRRLISPLKAQLIQGATPRSLAIAVAAATLCGIFPILGTTTLLATTVAIVFRLNQPVMHSLNWLLYPLQFALIPVFIRAGEFLFGADPITFSISQMLEIFTESPANFFARFWMTMVHCIVAWVVVAPFLGGALYLLVRPLLQSAAKRWRIGETSPPAIP